MPYLCTWPWCRRKRVLPVAVASLFALTSAHRSEAQQTVPASPQLPSYHSPLLALAQPANGGSVPQDRPVIVFRFAPGDSTDPVDARSFTVTVDGKDRSAGFQAAHDMVWGALAPPDEASGLTAGAHAIVARICSIRGSCGEVSASVMISASLTEANHPTTNRKRNLLDLLLAALRKLLAP